MPNAFIRNFFGFNRQQRNGLFVLLLISFLLLVARVVFPMFIIPGKIIVKDLPLYEKKLDSVDETNKKPKGHYRSYQKQTDLFAFDPNTVSLEQLLKLGFSEKKAGTFLKFRSRGFIFKKKEDLQKVYGISGHFYESLEPYILIREKAHFHKLSAGGSGPAGNSLTVSTRTFVQHEIPKQKKALTIIELNSADSAALEGLNGIGGAYAKRILKYRNMLGGFMAIEQLKEVYGFNDELFDKIKSHISVDPTLVKKINLNKDEFKVINKHPYLSYELTKIIFNFRRKTSITPTNLNEVLGDPVIAQKLLPYLVFE